MTLCAGCAARDQEIAWLRRALERAETRTDAQQDRMLALMSPLALAQARGERPVTEAAAPEVTTDEHGNEWVMLQGRKIKREDFEKLMRGEGAIDGTGQFVSAEDMSRAEDMLNRMLSGQPSGGDA